MRETCRAEEVDGTSPRGKRDEGQAHNSPATLVVRSSAQVVPERQYQSHDVMSSIFVVEYVCRTR
jgi:hypothetical protein